MRKREAALAAVVLLVAFGCLRLQGAGRSAGREAVVYDGKTRIAAYPLDTDADVLLEPESGGRNRLRIQDGRAWIEEADCPDLLCVKQGAVSKAGQSLICLPHRLTVLIEGGDRTELDAIAE